MSDLPGLQIDKIHKNNFLYMYLIIPTLSDLIFIDITCVLHMLGAGGRKIVQSVKLSLQPVILFKINIMMRSWNYFVVFYWKSLHVFVFSVS